MKELIGKSERDKKIDEVSKDKSNSMAPVQEMDLYAEKTRMQNSYARVVKMQKRKADEMADKIENKDQKKRTIQLMEDTLKTMNMMATAMTKIVRRGPSPVIHDPAIVVRLSAIESDIGQILDLSKNRV